MALCRMIYILDTPRIQFLNVSDQFLEAMWSRLPKRLRGPGRTCHPYVEPSTHRDRDDEFYFKSDKDEKYVKQVLREMQRELVAVRTISCMHHQYNYTAHIYRCYISYTVIILYRYPPVVIIC